MLIDLTNIWNINATIFYPIWKFSKQTNMFASCVSLYNAHGTWTSTSIANWCYVLFQKVSTQFFSNVKTMHSSTF